MSKNKHKQQKQMPAPEPIVVEEAVAAAEALAPAEAVATESRPAAAEQPLCQPDGDEATCCGGGDCDSCDRRVKLHSFNYLEDVPGGFADDNMVEVQFKNTRKGFYLNSQNIPLEIGDWVAVEASPGHDIGRVSLTGALVRLNMRKAGVKPDAEPRRVFRKAKASDMERFAAARARENDTMIRSRKIAASLQLNMKIGDVEYQGDGNKAIFYYIADERVDFRQLIKVLAETFRVRIEMKQIGARQEAGRIGGIGPCGRALCCTTWMSNFASVSTSAARYQDISLNPQKLAGQCAKLKCCLNFEIDTYVEASKKLPPKDARLETEEGTFVYFKADIFKREVTYCADKGSGSAMTTIPAARAFEIIEMNKRGEKPAKLVDENKDKKKEDAPTGYYDLVGQDSLTRFDSKKKKKKKKGKGADSKADSKADESQAKDAPQKDTVPKDNKPQPRQAKGDKPQPQGKVKAKPQQPKGQCAGQPKPQQPKNTERPKQRPPQSRQSGQQAPKPAQQPQAQPAPRLRPPKEFHNEPKAK